MTGDLRASPPPVKRPRMAAAGAAAAASDIGRGGDGMDERNERGGPCDQGEDRGPTTVGRSVGVDGVVLGKSAGIEPTEAEERLFAVLMEVCRAVAPNTIVRVAGGWVCSP